MPQQSKPAPTALGFAGQTVLKSLAVGDTELKDMTALIYELRTLMEDDHSLGYAVMKQLAVLLTSELTSFAAG